MCKGNQVADGPAGKNVSCPVFETHARLRLRPERFQNQHNPGTFPLVCSPLD